MVLNKDLSAMEEDVLQITDSEGEREREQGRGRGRGGRERERERERGKGGRELREGRIWDKGEGGWEGWGNIVLTITQFLH